MKRILIAEPSEDLANLWARQLRTHYEVHVCHTGGDALRLLEELQPDGLIIDLFLTGIDAVTVLRTATYIPLAILALTRYIDPYVSDAATLCGVGHILMMPCMIQAIARHLDKLLQT